MRRNGWGGEPGTWAHCKGLCAGGWGGKIAYCYRSRNDALRMADVAYGPNRRSPGATP